MKTPTMHYYHPHPNNHTTCNNPRHNARYLPNTTLTTELDKVTCLACKRTIQYRTKAHERWVRQMRTIAHPSDGNPA